MTAYSLPEWPTEVFGPLINMTNDYLVTLQFVIADTARDPSFRSDHLLFYLADDVIQSAVAITALAKDGALSVAKRELRFIIESSVKICFVQQKRYRSSTQEKLTEFDRVLAAPSISIKNDLDLAMLSSDLREEFGQEVGRLYGKTSGYVHLTPTQTLERIAAVDAGRRIGYESTAEIAELTHIVSCGFAASLVLLLHSVPSYVAGDWLVQSDGSTMPSYFLASRFIAAMDGHFDYKHERQADLAAIQAARASKVSF